MKHPLQSGPTDRHPANPPVPVPPRPVIYQVFTRHFGNATADWVPGGTKEENGVGRFSDMTAPALAAIRDLGATHVWYTGIIRHATQALDPPAIVKGRAGSPYAVTDWYDIDPDLATEPGRGLDEFRALVARTGAADLGTLIDFVPNHVARSYHSTAKPAGVRDFGEDDDPTTTFSPGNNYYWLPGQSLELPPPAPGVPPYHETPARASGNDVFQSHPSADDWYETVKLNYGVDYQNGRSTHFDPIPDTWLKMRHILHYWADFGIAGFRCDMAEMVPVEFWAWVIPQVKARHPGLIFVAEIYNPGAYRTYLDQGCFDYLYDKVGLYDAIRAVIQDPAAPASPIIEAWCAVENIQDHVVNFLENHDEQRFCSRFFASDPRWFFPALTASAGLGRGAYLVYAGQEWAEPADGAMGFSGDDGRSSIFDYISVPSLRLWSNGGRWDGALHSPEIRKIRDWHGRVLNDLARQDCLARGTTTILGGTHPRVLAWLRSHGGSTWLFAANFDSTDHLVVHGSRSFLVRARGSIWMDRV